MVIQFHTFLDNIEHLKAFVDVYDLLRFYTPPNNNNRPKRKSKSKMVCRFCSKGNTETTFKSKPHIISRLFGNNSGISDYECYNCNSHFSKFESDAANFLGLQRSIFSLGKQTIPTFKAPDGSMEARDGNIFGHNAIEISAKMPGFITSVKDTGKIQIKVTGNSYIPLNVYKSLLKIALTIIPEYETKYYEHALQFLMLGENTDHFAQHAEQIFICESGFETVVPFAFIFKKKDKETKLPTHFFKLYYQDSYIQFYLPNYARDKRLEVGESICIPRCPPLIRGDIWPSGAANYVVVDLSSEIKKIGEVKNLYINFDKDKLAKTLPINFETHEINGVKFDPSEIVKIYFARDNPEETQN